MKRIILTTVSVLALGLGGAGLSYAAGDMSGNAETAPSATGTSTMPSAAGTSQSPYSAGTTSQSTMPSMSGTSQWGTSSRTGGRNEIMDVQQKLQADNLYNGKIDGLLGPQTRRAIREFQQQNNLRVTARLDRETRNSLLGTGSVGQGSSIPPKSNTPMMPSTAPSPSHSGTGSTTK